MEWLSTLRVCLYSALTTGSDLGLKPSLTFIHIEISLIWARNPSGLRLLISARVVGQSPLSRGSKLRHFAVWTQFKSRSPDSALENPPMLFQNLQGLCFPALPSQNFSLPSQEHKANSWFKYSCSAFNPSSPHKMLSWKYS